MEEEHVRSALVWLAENALEEDDLPVDLSVNHDFYLRAMISKDHEEY